MVVHVYIAVLSCEESIKVVPGGVGEQCGASLRYVRGVGGRGRGVTLIGAIQWERICGGGLGVGGR